MKSFHGADADDDLDRYINNLDNCVNYPNYPNLYFTQN